MRRGIVVALALVTLAVVTAAAVPVSPAEHSSPAGDDSRQPAIGASDGGRPTSPVESGARVHSVVQAGNATAYLAIPAADLETAGYQRAPIDVAGVLALDAATIQGRLAAQVADERFETASSPTTRRARLRERATTIESRIATLRDRQSSAIRAFNDGTTTERAFLRALVVIDAAAEDLASAIERVETRARSVPGIAIGDEIVTTWARDRRLALGTLQGPVRDRLAETIDSEVDPPPIHVETTEGGVVLAAVSSNRYYREAVLPAKRPPRNTSQAGTPSTNETPWTNTTPSTNATTTVAPRNITGIADALDRVAQLYPDAWRASTGTDSAGGQGTNVSRVTVFYDRGRLTVYLDRETGSVFAEQQRRWLTAVPTVGSAANTTDELTLRVNWTHPTGPLAVELSESLTGDPVNGTVTVDGVLIEETGPDGGLWTLQPRGAFTVTAQRGNDSVRVAVNATAET